MNNHLLLVFLFLLTISINLTAQYDEFQLKDLKEIIPHQKYLTPMCGFQPTNEQIDALESNPEFQETQRWFLNNYNQRSLQPINYVPIKAHIVRTSAGTGGLTVTQLTAAIADMNTYFINANLQFYLCNGINYIDDNTYYNFDGSQEMALHGAHGIPNLINIYFCNSVTLSGVTVCGFTHFPGAGPDVIMMRNSCTSDRVTLAHEMGHFFSLHHTHGVTNGVLTTELYN